MYRPAVLDGGGTAKGIPEEEKDRYIAEPGDRSAGTRGMGDRCTKTGEERVVDMSAAERIVGYSLLRGWCRG